MVEAKKNAVLCSLYYRDDTSSIFEGRKQAIFVSSKYLIESIDNLVS